MKKLTVFIFNAVIAAVCAAAIALYFVFPLWSINLGYTFTSENLSSMIDIEDVDVSELLDEDISVNISLSVSSKTALSSYTSNDGAEMLETMLDDSIDDIVDEVVAAMDNLMQSVTRSAINTYVSDELNTMLADYLDTEEADEVTTLMAEAGVDDDYLTEKLNSVVDTVFEEGATIESVTEAAIAAFEETYATLSGSDVEAFADLTLSADMEENIASVIENLLSDYADEDGTINVSLVSQQALLSALQSMNGTASASQNAPLAVKLSDESGTTSSETMTEEELRAEIASELKIYLMSTLLTDDVTSVLQIAFLALAILLTVSLASWAYLILKIVLKLFAKNPAIKLKCPIFLGWLPYLLLALLPTFAFKFANVVTEGFLADSEIATLLEGVSVSFSSSGFYAMIFAAVLIVIWIFYRPLRNALRGDKKKNKEKE